MLKHAGLTDVVRMMLQSTEGYTTVTQIVDTLKAIAYPLGRLENPRAALVVVMSRLVDRGDVERKDIGKIEPAFRWIHKTSIGQLMQQIGTGISEATPQEGLADRLAKQFMEARKKK